MQIKSLAFAVLSTATVASAAYGAPEDSVVADVVDKTYESVVADETPRPAYRPAKTAPPAADEVKPASTYGKEAADSVVADEVPEHKPAYGAAAPVADTGYESVAAVEYEVATGYESVAAEDEVKCGYESVVADEVAETPCPSGAEDDVAGEVADKPAYTPVHYESVVADESYSVVAPIASEGLPTPCPSRPGAPLGAGNDAAHPPKYLRPTPAPTVSYNEVAADADDVVGVEYAVGAASSNIAIGMLSMVLPVVVYLF